MKTNYFAYVASIAGFLAALFLITQAYGAPKNAQKAVSSAHKVDSRVAHESTLEMREQEAFDLFMHLLVCPVDQVPTWKEFVDRMAELMEGNPRYAALRDSLLKVRDVSGLTGKHKISKVLTEHEAAIPTEIVTKTKSLSWFERARRIKFY